MPRPFEKRAEMQRRKQQVLYAVTRTKHFLSFLRGRPDTTQGLVDKCFLFSFPPFFLIYWLLTLTAAQEAAAAEMSRIRLVNSDDASRVTPFFTNLSWPGTILEEDVETEPVRVSDATAKLYQPTPTVRRCSVLLKVYHRNAIV